MNEFRNFHRHLTLMAATCAVWTASRTLAQTPAPPRAGSVLQPTTVSTSEFTAGDVYTSAEAIPIDAPSTMEHGAHPWAGHDACNSPNCGQCVRFYDAWARGDYLLWWRKGADLPPLVSTGPLEGTNSVLFGGDNVGSDIEGGGRVELGVWLDACHDRGIGGRYFALGDETIQFNSDGLTNVARPFIDLTPGSPGFGMENALVVNAPGGPTGSVNVRMTSEVYGSDIFYRRVLRRTECSRLDFLVGYQTSRIDEGLAITHQFVDGGVTVDGLDLFDASNEFHGGQVGLLASRRDCRWTLDVLAKIGLGNMDSTVVISGAETRQPPVVTSTGSLLALPTNIGRYSRDEFAAVPELGVNVSYQLTNRLDFTAGYSIIYWSDVLLPGDQIDRTVNATQTSGGTLMGQARPQFAFVNGDYWVQGINLGLTWRR